MAKKKRRTKLTLTGRTPQWQTQRQKELQRAASVPRTLRESMLAGNFRRMNEDQAQNIFVMIRMDLECYTMMNRIKLLKGFRSGAEAIRYCIRKYFDEFSNPRIEE